MFDNCFVFIFLLIYLLNCLLLICANNREESNGGETAWQVRYTHPVVQKIVKKEFPCSYAERVILANVINEYYLFLDYIYIYR